MAEKLTEQQKLAVENRGGELLVSAAAGSGKTKVLVDRLMGYLTDPVNPANLDDFLIITYTKAAASELRGKIAAKLNEKIALQPENRHLQQQLQRLYLAKISTVHSFCADVLREYAYRLDISADFRVLEEREAADLQERVMQQILDESYNDAASNPEFTALVDSQGLGRDDRKIPEVIYEVYSKAICHLNPKEWLRWCVTACDASEKSDLCETVWGKYLIDNLHDTLDLHIAAMSQCAQKAAQAEGMEKPAALLADTVSQLQLLRQCDTWDAIYRRKNIAYGKLLFGKNVTDDILAGRIKAVRSACKDEIEKKLKAFTDDSAQILKDMQKIVPATKGLVSLVEKFMDSYDRLKDSRRILDFSDLEHKTLDLLVGKDRALPTAVAREIGQRFREVMVDEYQDSNIVQDSIFAALTKERHNCFMVGDVKQSIYQFRLADPGIFLQKYNTYQPAQCAEAGQGRKILLSSNFRSAGNVIEAVNHVFHVCMSQRVGGLTYGDEEKLNEGIAHEAVSEPEVELYAIDVQENKYPEEAAFTAKRICQLLDGKHLIREKDALRPITAGDIAILLRSPNSDGEEFRKALESVGIKCVTGNSTDLLKTEEIETLWALLQVIDNPLQDIPLLTVLSSRVFCFTANDLAAVRSQNKSGSIYEALKASTQPKATSFIHMLNCLREEARLNSLSQLLNKIFVLTKFDTIYRMMAGGDEKVENLQSFCRIVGGFESGDRGGLGQFLSYLDAMTERGLATEDRGSNPDAVSIMSIHKSKGLEFPVVFLCGLSKRFNGKDLQGQVLCHKELGLGLACADIENRVHYPSVAKRAIAAKMNEEMVSEELRVLYVAMTRAKDRLIMTYADSNIQKKLSFIAQRMDFSAPLLMTAYVNCPGDWVLYSALMRQEAKPLFDIAARPDNISIYDNPWLIRVVTATPNSAAVKTEDVVVQTGLQNEDVAYIKKNLAFRYPYMLATTAPSKQTATQLKGRGKDTESAENAPQHYASRKKLRVPSFAQEHTAGKDYGTAHHSVMEHIRYEKCSDVAGVGEEIRRLVEEKYISSQQAQMINCDHIAAFFQTEIGKRLQTGEHVIREFKFSILDDGERYVPGMKDERILLQGVVDCAFIEEDGITIVDFKTDRVTQETVAAVAENYRAQIDAYCGALSRVYQKPIKSAMLYFFRIGQFVKF